LKIAVFGAGRHSVWLEAFVSDMEVGPEVTAVLDDASRNRRLWGLKVIEPDRFQISGVDAVFISTDFSNELFL